MANKTRKPMLLADAFVIFPDEKVYGPYPYNGLQVLGFVIAVFFPALSLTTCGLRVYSRRLAKGFGMDDWLIFLAMTLALVQAVFTAFVLRSGYWGIHDASVPPNTPSNLGALWVFLNGLVYNPLLALVKVSALLFLLRLGGTKTRVRRACQAMILFNLLQLLVFLPIAVVQCLPIAAQWVTFPGGLRPKCIRRDIYSLSLAVVNIVTDVLTLLIPFFIFLDLKLNRRVRNALLVVFLLGGLVTIISGVRLYYIIRVYYLTVEDRRYSLGYVTSLVEINLAIITASVPALWPLARRWMPGAFETLGIHRPYMHPDIEVEYASCGGRMLRAKVMWNQSRGAPAAGVAMGAGSRDGAALAGGRESPMHIMMRGRDMSSIKSGSSGSGRSGEKRGGWQDDEGPWMTYHDLVRETGGDGVRDQGSDGMSSIEPYQHRGAACG